MNRLVQWGVVIGVWECLLVDVIGNWAGQDHYPAWIPIIEGTAAFVVVLHVAAAIDLTWNRRTDA